MPRREFPRKIWTAAVKRATRDDGQVYCEKCGLPTLGRFQVDHRRADGLGGEPTLENAQVLGFCCYSIKNPQDTTAVAKAKRRESRDLGFKKAPARKIPQRAKAERPKREQVPVSGVPEIARRFGVLP